MNSHRRASTLRVRLTLLYAGTFFLAGVTLVVFTYLHLGWSLDRQAADRAGDIEQHITGLLSDTQATPERSARLHQVLQAQAEQERDRTLSSMRNWSLLSVGAIALVAAGFGWTLAGRALHPLQQITATARRVADRSLHERIALDGPDDEIKDLADTFDAMLERLDRAFDGQRRFVANASHELRTPLTINRTMIEVALEDPAVPEPTRRLATGLLTVNQRHERLIDGLLLLATSDQDLIERRPVDLADIARHATDVHKDTARKAGVEIRASIAPAPVIGDPLLLERIALNLLDNAVRYNIAESGQVSITTGTADGYARLTVDNTGPAVPRYEIDNLFEPFRRLASTDRLAEGPDHRTPSRGAGLGLSIVRSVTHAHHGQVNAHPRPDGGLSITVQIPAPPGAADEPARPRDDRRGPWTV